MLPQNRLYPVLSLFLAQRSARDPSVPGTSMLALRAGAGVDAVEVAAVRTAPIRVVGATRTI